MLQKEAVMPTSMLIQINCSTHNVIMVNQQKSNLKFAHCGTFAKNTEVSIISAFVFNALTIIQTNGNIVKIPAIVSKRNLIANVPLCFHRSIFSMFILFSYQDHNLYVLYPINLFSFPVTVICCLSALIMYPFFRSDELQ